MLKFTFIDYNDQFKGVYTFECPTIKAGIKKIRNIIGVRDIKMDINGFLWHNSVRIGVISIYDAQGALIL